MPTQEPPVLAPPSSLTGTTRSDIQGIRAVAVLSVMATHAGLPLPGGFVGVDIFFVVSGFVITLMLLREWRRDGRINLSAFYRRRIRRLTPAAGALIAVTGLGALLLLPPDGTTQAAAATGLGSDFFIANWVISVLAVGYFGPSAQTNPLLHMWSLAVEEQFYLAFPLLLLFGLILGRRFNRARSGALLVTGLVFVASLLMIRGAALPLPDWLFGYYSPLNRAWEFAAGAGTALLTTWVPRLSGRLALLLQGVGVAGTIASFILINEATPFPGKATLLPVVATSLLIFGGSWASTAVSRTLSHPWAVWIGDRSYSLYLWHWPMIVFSATLWPASVLVTTLAAAVSAVPAVWSYRFLEQPLRRGPVLNWSGTLRTFGSFILGPALMCGGVWVVADRWGVPAFSPSSGWETHQVPQWVRSYPVNSDLGSDCPDPSIGTLIGDNGLCLQTHPGDPLRVVIIGDSHAEHLLAGFHDGLAGTNVGVMSLRSTRLFGGPANLAAAARAVAAMPDVRVVILSWRWSDKTLDQGAPNLTSLVSTVADLRAAGKEVLLPDDVFDFPFSGSQCQYRIAPAIPFSRCDWTSTWNADQHAADLIMLNGLAARYDARVVPTWAELCPGEPCSMLRGGHLIYADNNHLNPAGSRLAFGAFAQDPALQELP